jgi:serine/threonine protein kinase
VLLVQSTDDRQPASLPDTGCLSSYLAKLGDFGLAKLVAAQDNETRTGALLGTPAYMPPEQATGALDTVGPAADIYGLGTILYELLTGRAPFVGASDAETLHQVIASEPLAIAKLRPGVPMDLAVICLKCLEKKPQARYRSAAALADGDPRACDCAYPRDGPTSGGQCAEVESRWSILGRNRH